MALAAPDLPLAIATHDPLRGRWQQLTTISRGIGESLSRVKEITTMPRTGDHATVTGEYKADYHTPCGNAERLIHMIAGREFPPCPHCHHAVTWTLVRAG